jgi:hypothetical protein
MKNLFPLFGTGRENISLYWILILRLPWHILDQTFWVLVWDIPCSGDCGVLGCSLSTFSLLPREYLGCFLLTKGIPLKHGSSSYFRTKGIIFKSKEFLVSSTASGHQKDWLKFEKFRDTQRCLFARCKAKLDISQPWWGEWWRRQTNSLPQVCSLSLCCVMLRQEVLSQDLWVIDTDANFCWVGQPCTIFKGPPPHASLWRACFTQDKTSKLLLFNFSQEAKALINENPSIHVFTLLPKKLSSKQKSS